jgi:hypothetical protein
MGLAYNVYLNSAKIFGCKVRLLNVLLSEITVADAHRSAELQNALGRL